MTDRELDALVAEKVMGLKCRNGLWDHGQWLTMPMHDGSCLVRWSSTGDGMLAVIEAMRKKGWTFSVEEYTEVSEDPVVYIAYFNAFGKPEAAGSGSDKIPTTVADAALRALGVKVPA